MEGVIQLKLFISFAIEDQLWANQINNFLQDFGFSIQIECLTNEHLFGNNYTPLDKNKQYVHVIILSNDYLKHEKRLQTFCKIHTNEGESKTLDKLLNTSPSICIHIDQSVLPDYIHQSKKVKLLDWQPDNEIAFWKRFGKLCKALEKKILIRNTLHKDFQNNNIVEKEHFKETETSNISESDKTESDEENVADVSKDYDYENYNKVYPHLLSNSFTAEDRDLSKSDIEDLTMKVEDIETMLSIDLSTGTPTEGTVIAFPKNNFLSQLEQMDVLDLLYTVRQRVCGKIEKCVNDPFRRKIYQRLLKRYDISIKYVLNGEKNKIDLASLPLLNMLTKSENASHFATCCCCDALFHSERALEIHFEQCVKESWKRLMKLK